MSATVLGVLLVLVGVLIPAIAFVAGQIQKPPVLGAVGSVFVFGVLTGWLLIRFAGRSLRHSRVLQIGLGTGLAVGIAFLGWLQHLGAFDRSKVSLANGVLLIQGKLDDEMLSSFRRVLDSGDLHDVRVRLRSPGGNIYVGMAIGREIHRRQLDVEVDRCHSSCANYLFTAGRNKYLQSADQVQFHGGALQPNYVAAALKLIEQGKQLQSGEDLPQDLDPKHLRKLYGLVDDFPFNAAASILAEKSFFDEIGVSALTPVYGQYGDYSAWVNDGVHDNFSYLREDYAQLGVENVFFTDTNAGSRFGSKAFRARTSAASIDAQQAELTTLYRKIEVAMLLSADDIWRPLNPGLFTPPAAAAAAP